MHGRYRPASRKVAPKCWLDYLRGAERQSMPWARVVSSLGRRDQAWNRPRLVAALPRAADPTAVRCDARPGAARGRQRRTQARLRDSAGGSRAREVASRRHYFVRRSVGPPARPLHVLRTSPSHDLRRDEPRNGSEAWRRRRSTSFRDFGWGRGSGTSPPRIQVSVTFDCGVGRLIPDTAQ